MKLKFTTILTYLGLVIAISFAVGLMSRHYAGPKGNLKIPWAASSAVASRIQQSITLPNASIYGLNADNVLYVLQPGSQNFNRVATMSGLGQANVIGIDYRVSNGLLYGLTDQHQLITIN